MLRNQFFQLTSKILLLVVISQLAMMNLTGLLQFKLANSTDHSTTFISAPCPKTAHTQAATFKTCENGYSAFLNIAAGASPFFSYQKNVFTHFIVTSHYSTPIYYIYKPPKN
jgi:hypothetical protein